MAHHESDPLEQYYKKIQTHGRPLASFKKGSIIHANVAMSPVRSQYTYTLEADPGQGFDPLFKPYMSPAEILAMGAFEGKYLNDSYNEFPAEWFIQAAALNKLRPAPLGPDPTINYFGVKSRLPLTEWRKSGWAPRKGGSGLLGDPKQNPDERGWFQWYCRYWMGRRIPELDAKQIARWRSFKRHSGAVRKGCPPRKLSCRPVERQALLHWAYNPFI